MKEYKGRWRDWSSWREKLGGWRRDEKRKGKGKRKYEGIQGKMEIVGGGGRGVMRGRKGGPE